MGQKHFLSLGLALVAIPAAGCGPDISGTCQAQEACIGGNELDVDACIAATDGEREAAFDIGCGSEFDLLADCLAPKLECTTVMTGQNCMADADCNGAGVCSAGQCTVKTYGLPSNDQNACEAERNAYSRCE
jgi:hypothetical protein